MRKFKPKACRTCGQTISIELQQKKELARAKKISLALYDSETVGRPRKNDHSAIRKLRAEGKTLSQIQNILKCGRGSVQYALRPKSTRE